MTSLSGLVGNLGVASRTSVVSERFEFIFLQPTASGVAELVRGWYAWAAPDLADKAGHPTLLVRTEGVRTGVYG